MKKSGLKGVVRLQISIPLLAQEDATRSQEMTTKKGVFGMVHFVWFMGVVTAVWRIVVLFKPTWLKQLAGFLSKGKVVYAVAGLKILIGVFFLILATQCKLTGVIIALGILTAGGSIIFCLLPFTKIKAYMKWWTAQPLWMYRLWAIVAVLLGGLIMYAGVPK
jgi:hypothetical protein